MISMRPPRRSYAAFPGGRAVPVLSRRCDAAIPIGPDGQATVLGIQGRPVKLGIDVPRNVRVRRDERDRRGLRSLENHREGRTVGQRVAVEETWPRGPGPA